jgi:hypothetical protein
MHKKDKLPLHNIIKKNANVFFFFLFNFNIFHMVGARIRSDTLNCLLGKRFAKKRNGLEGFT